MVPPKHLFEDFVEFGSVPAAMFTSFRCFTDGCAATDGTPLQDLGLLEVRKGGLEAPVASAASSCKGRRATTAACSFPLKRERVLRWRHP